MESLVILSGLLTHWLYFFHGEHDNWAAVYVRGYAVLTVLGFLVEWNLSDRSGVQALMDTFKLVSIHLFALFSSILAYRLIFSPLRHIPGPLPARSSKLYHFWMLRNGLRNYEFLETLYQTYGDVVRTGPNEVTIFTLEGFEKIYAAPTGFLKTVLYDAPKPLTSLVNQRDILVHARLHKAWDHAFNQKALESYTPVVQELAEKLMNRLQDASAQPVKIHEWFEHYVFDLIGLLGLDCDFNTLEEGPCRAIELYRQGSVLGWISIVPWLFHAAAIIPGIKKNYFEKVKWVQCEILEKKEAKPEKRTVIDHIINDSMENGGFDANWERMQGEWVAIMAAGIDPMWKCLTTIVYYLITDNRHVVKIRQELDTLDSIHDYRKLQDLPYLNAVILETLRLHPAIPSSGGRLVPPEGLAVSGYFIPGGTTVLVPHHVLFRRDDCFNKPLEFQPERFTTHPEMILQSAAFKPWSVGKFQCVGKYLGLMEIRIALAMIVARFELDFAPGEDGQKLFKQTRDHFTSSPGPLNVILSPRNVMNMK